MPAKSKPEQQGIILSMLEHLSALILDMDGVLWRDKEPIGNLPAIFARFDALQLKVALATNNSTRSVEQYLEKLAGLGVQTLQPWQIITSSQAVAALLKRDFPNGGPVFAIGEDGLKQELASQGFEPLPVEAASRACAVVMGIDREINFNKISEATLLVRSGAPFYATNPDKTFPTPRGEIPGAGAWQSILVTASNVVPKVAGKPSPFMMQLALERLGTPAEKTLVVGDRIETDILSGQAVGCKTCLVLTGIASRAEGQAHQPAIDVIAESLSALVGLA